MKVLHVKAERFEHGVIFDFKRVLVLDEKGMVVNVYDYFNNDARTLKTIMRMIKKDFNLEVPMIDRTNDMYLIKV